MKFYISGFLLALTFFAIGWLSYQKTHYPQPPIECHSTEPLIAECDLGPSLEECERTAMSFMFEADITARALNVCKDNNAELSNKITEISKGVANITMDELNSQLIDCRKEMSRLAAECGLASPQEQ